MSPSPCSVDRTGRGAWGVAMPDQRERVTRETLESARRVAYLCAARRRPCELVVCDAYHSVLHRELINGHGDPAGTGGRGSAGSGPAVTAVVSLPFGARPTARPPESVTGKAA